MSNYKHGLRYSREYETFNKMKNRCNNPNDRRYPIYGGRGIKCLYSDFVDFLHDVGLRPSDQHQIDRIDNNGNYEVGNCRWVTRKENGRNRRDNKLITYNGETRTMVEWAEVSGLQYQTLVKRLTVYNWDVGKALTTPVRFKKTI